MGGWLEECEEDSRGYTGILDTGGLGTTVKATACRCRRGLGI
jgi:hypothetical protein